MALRLLILALLLVPNLAVAQTDPEPGGLPLDELSEVVLPNVARVSASGRVGSGIVVNGGTHVVTLLHTVSVGYPAAVQTGTGHVSLGRIVAWDLSLIHI